MYSEPREGGFIVEMFKCTIDLLQLNLGAWRWEDNEWQGTIGDMANSGYQQITIGGALQLLL